MFQRQSPLASPLSRSPGQAEGRDPAPSILRGARSARRPPRGHPPPRSSAPPPRERETPQGSLNTSYKYHGARRARHCPAGFRLAAVGIICIVGRHHPAATWAGARLPLPRRTSGRSRRGQDHRVWGESGRGGRSVVPASPGLRLEDCGGSPDRVGCTLMSKYA